MDADKKKILLVEDEVIIAMTEKKQLEKYGYVVTYVSNGEDAVRLALNNDSSFDVILMDIDLGLGIDGTEASEEILKKKDIPIVFLSSHTEAEIVAKTERITSYGYVVKNSGIVILDASIKMALKLFDEKIERKRAEEALRVSEQWYRVIYDTSPLAIVVWDRECRVVDWNRNSEIMFGWKREEILGKNFFEFLLPSSALSSVKEIVDLLLEGKIPNQSTNENLTKCGETIVCEWNNAIQRDSQGQVIGVISLALDITDRKKTEKALQASEHMFRSITHNAADAIFIKDIHRRYTFVNPAAQRLIGLPLEMIIGSTPEQVYGIEQSLVIKEVDDRAFAGESINETRCLEIGNAKYYLSTSQGPLTVENGVVTSIMGIVRNMTAQTLAEEEVQKQLAEKEILLREVHHRIKNNMANVEGLLSLQADLIDNPEAKAALQDSIVRIQSMRILYDKLLLTKDYHDISIASYVEGLVDSISVIFAMENKITIKKQITDFSIVPEKAIPVGIIINELLTNVFKYAFMGRDNGTVSILIEKFENLMTLMIEDNGIGMDEKISLNQSPGLGLTIVKMLVAQLKGTYKSINGNGTKIIIQFAI